MIQNHATPVLEGTGIASLGLHLPPLGMKVADLARLRGVDPQKYLVGLECEEFGVCPPNFNVIDLATEASRRALSRWDGDPSQIGMVVVGTETAVDMSRPLSAFVAERLDLRGAIRSYEVKHACYGGTLALRQALEWRLSGAAQGKAALVVAADVATYAQDDPGEPTQGAGAVAFIVDAPEIATIETVSYPYSEPAFDFYRPVGEDYPTVDGKLSLDCYKRAAEACFKALIGKEDPEAIMDSFEALCFHVPFPKMVRKAVLKVGETFGWGAEKVNDLFHEKVEPTMLWNKFSGNAYTASLWISVAGALQGLRQGEKIAAFSYGSGFGSELLQLIAGPRAAEGAWAEDIRKDLAARGHLTGDAYHALRNLGKLNLASA